jgi:hypothetical protein
LPKFEGIELGAEPAELGETEAPTFVGPSLDVHPNADEIAADAAAFRVKIAAGVAKLEAAADAWATLTAAQKDAAMLGAVRVSAAIARLVLRRLY